MPTQEQGQTHGIQVDINDIKLDMGDLFVQAKAWERLATKQAEQIRQLHATIQGMEEANKKEV